MDPDTQTAVEGALRPLNCLRMAVVKCEMEFDQMDIAVALNNDIVLLVVITNNPVRATIEFEYPAVPP